MALPSGYSKIDYIEATGTQYINTGFKPNGNSRIVMDCEPTNLSSAFCFFCARTEINASDTTANVALYLGRKYRKDFYGESQSTTAAYTAGTRFTIDSNKNEVAFGADYTLTFTASSKVSPMPLILMASAVPGDTDGTFKSLANYAKMKLYGAKIYDNGTLVRDFIPCKNASGTLGLWDNVNSVFYANAGTGTFSTDTKHKTLIDGAGYEIKSGRVLIAGTGYDIKKGRTLIGGTGYDIKFGVPVGELAEGTIIKINENGSPVEFYIAKHDYESDLNGTGRTLVVRKSSYSIVYDECKKSFFTSTVYTLLNNTYFKLLDTNIQSAIGKTKFKYTGKINDYSNESQYVANGESSVFLLSATELGTTSTEGMADGSVLPTANILKIAYYNGSAAKQLTRTRSNASPGHLMHFKAEGTLGNTIYEDVPYRPVFTLSAGTLIDSDFNIVPA